MNLQASTNEQTTNPLSSYDEYISHSDEAEAEVYARAGGGLVPPPPGANYYGGVGDYIDPQDGLGLDYGTGEVSDDSNAGES